MGKCSEWVRMDAIRGTSWWNRVSIVNNFGSFIIVFFFLKNMAKGIIMWCLVQFAIIDPPSPPLKHSYSVKTTIIFHSFGLTQQR